MDALKKLLSELDFGLGYDSWIGDYSHVFRTLYYRDIAKYIQFQKANLSFQTHYDFEPVCLAPQECHRIFCGIKTGNR